MSSGKYHNLHSSAFDRPSRMVSKREIIDAVPEVEPTYASANALFAVRLTRSFADRMNWEDPNDPLLLQVLPHPDELLGEGLSDPVGDARQSPVPWIVRKHEDRVLLLVTKQCHLHCRYCFRRTYDPSDRAHPSAQEWQAAMEYLEKEQPNEVILSGGDPLTLSNQKLFKIIDEVSQHCTVLRIHSRAPVTEPSRIDQALVDGLRARRPIWFVTHCNHVNELNDDVLVAFRRIVDAGIPLLNQMVLLKNVNDSVESLKRLCEALVREGVAPYYLHHPDRVRGANHFYVEIEDGQRIYRELRRVLSGVACPKYVIDPPDGRGKRSVMEWESSV